jgi:hypothetical protein
VNIDPRLLTTIQWTDAMTLQLVGYAQPPRLDEPERWQEWALVVNLAPRIAAFNPPNPYAFNDWRDWATRFNQAVDLTT